MKYIIDSSSLINIFRNFSEDTFPTFWKEFYKMVDKNKIISVREALNEIKDNQDRLSSWAQERKKTLFLKPIEEELEFIEKIFQETNYQKLIDRKKIKSGGHMADPFIIAKAKHVNGCVITEDGFFLSGRLKNEKGNGKISLASVCRDINIDCVNFNGFMKKEGWEF